MPRSSVVLGASALSLTSSTALVIAKESSRKAGFVDDAAQDVVLTGAQRTGFDDRYFVTSLGFILFIVGHKLRTDGVLLAVQGVSFAGQDGDDDRFIAFT